MFKFKYIIFSLIILISFSCKKESPKPNNQNIVDDKVYDFVDIEWVLHSGSFYMENLDTDEKMVFDHFGSTQFSSTLNPISGASIPFDTITRKLTKWKFTSDKFILNNSKQYSFTKFDNTLSIIGMESGSSRPVTIIKLDDVSISFKVYEGYGSRDGYNFNFYSVLTFVKSGETCNSCVPDTDYGYTYGGVIDNNPISNSSLVGTKWVITKFYDGFSNTYPNDTLDFFSGSQYAINGGQPRNYTKSNIFGNNMTDLTLYGLTTLGGDYSGDVMDDFIQTGEINSVQFEDLFNTNQTKTVWMIRIQ